VSEEAKLKCTDCGAEGIIYMVDGEPVCSRCMSKRRPPLTYNGPDRRRRQAPTPFLRRETDKNKITKKTLS
jgi:DNA-directed RNA polymerase subunit RPC12/RpoP